MHKFNTINEGAGTFLQFCPCCGLVTLRSGEKVVKFSRRGFAQLADQIRQIESVLGGREASEPMEYGRYVAETGVC